MSRPQRQHRRRYAIGQRNTEIHPSRSVQGMIPRSLTIQWEMLSNAEFSVAIPLYSHCSRGQPLL
ncbi:MAG: hypothetical protein ACLU37_10270 [Collinsella sp.]